MGRRVENEDGSEIYYLNNHLQFTILYHQSEGKEGYRIVGFEVLPMSIKHT